MGNGVEHSSIEIDVSKDIQVCKIRSMSASAHGRPTRASGVREDKQSLDHQEIFRKVE